MKKVGTTYSGFHKGFIIPPQLLNLDQPDLKITQRNSIVFREGEGLPRIPYVFRILACTTVTFLAPRAIEIAKAPANRPDIQKLAQKLGNYVGIEGVLSEVECSNGCCGGPNFVLYLLRVLVRQPMHLTLEKRVEGAIPPMGLITLGDPWEFSGEVVEYFEKVGAPKEALLVLTSFTVHQINLSEKPSNDPVVSEMYFEPLGLEQLILVWPLKVSGIAGFVVAP